VQLYKGKQRPIIPGHENVGIIAEIDRRTGRKLDFYGEELREGDRIFICPDIICGKCYYCTHTYPYTWCENMRSYGTTMSCDEPPHLFGGWAEYIYIFPEVYTYKVPEGMPSEIAVLAENITVASGLDNLIRFSSIASEGFHTEDTILIQGGGPIGLAHLIRARVIGGGIIIVTDLSNYRLRIAEECGADYIINVNNSTSKERIQRIKELTRSRGVDVVVNCTGVPEVIPEGLETLRKGGIYLDPGTFVDKTILLNPYRQFVAKSIRYIGLSNISITGLGIALKLMKHYLKRFPFEKIVTHKYKLDEVDQALKKSMESETMKVIVAP